MLRIEGLQKSYGERILLSGASYQFPAGERIALVGANGAGKTTLLNMLCGRESQDSGKIILPSQVKLGYLPQNPNPDAELTVLAEAKAGAKEIAKLEKDLEDALAILQHKPGDQKALARFEETETLLRLADGYSIEARAQAVLKGLGFSHEDLLKSPKSLSGGWRMRLELARLFLSKPDFLILDEPTNHLDLPSLVWVEDWLLNFRGTLLFVSHDRALLNRLATYTLHLQRGVLSPYRGNFDAFLDQREARMEEEQATRDQLRRRRESMEKFVQRFGAKATKATQAQSRLKMIARIKDLEENLDFSAENSESNVFIHIPSPSKTPRIVYELESGDIGYAKPLAKGVSLSLERGQKVAIIGANGIGKSTLLRTIAGRLQPLAGRFNLTPGVDMAYFAQDQAESLDMEASVLTNLLRETGLGEPAARQLLGGFLFRGDDVFKKTKVLSGGELSRLGLACALGKKSGLILLDEPTNHLDMASVESLASGLDEFEGTVLFVSHDRTFIDSVCTHVFAMLPDGRSRIFPGKLNDYEKLAAVSGFPNVLEANPETKHTNPSDAEVSPLSTLQKRDSGHLESKERRSQLQKLRKKISHLELEMTQIRAQIAKIEEEMANLSAHDFSKTAELHLKVKDLKNHLDQKEEDWLSASSELETLNA
jgi:ATP-binding cassette subfamily F protein 3